MIQVFGQWLYCVSECWVYVIYEWHVQAVCIWALYVNGTTLVSEGGMDNGKVLHKTVMHFSLSL